ncbi:MAG: HEPN domain-containing protein [Acidobacteria bacterium]|nr:HEPN domain-containing protein [Acidobacteriota bacterium]
MWDSAAEAERWHRTAEDDLEFARLALETGFYHKACFNAQQAGEMAIKAVAYGLGERVVLGHSIAELVKRYADRVPGLGDLSGDAGLLDQYYVPTRYPNGLPGGVPSESYGEAQAASAIDAAERLLHFAASYRSSTS